MKDWSKTAIRLQSIAARQLKISYKRLQPEEKKLVKILENLDLNEREMDSFWRTHTKRDENNHIILDEEESALFKFLDERGSRSRKRLDRITEKNNWTDEQVNKIWRSHQQHNCHSVSYGY